jgi:tetratricopeptide (TPR) repeat protein
MPVPFPNSRDWGLMFSIQRETHQTRSARKTDRACARWSVLLLVAFAIGTAVHAAEDDAAAQRRGALRFGDLDARRAAAVWLAEHGAPDAVPALADALRDEDQGVRVLSEEAMWSIWTRSGDASIDEQLKAGSVLMQEQRFEEALGIFDEIVKQAPEFPEGYNKRATALYYLGQYQRSLDDIRETLARNQYHFGALSGAGLCWMALEEPVQALYYFERALSVNPNLSSIRNAVEQLRRMTEEHMM